MTEQEIQELQNKVLEMSRQSETYKTNIETLTKERDNLKTQNETLSTSNNEYRDLNAKLSLRVATQFTDDNINISQQKPKEKEIKEVELNINDLLKDL